MTMFKKAERKASKLRIGLVGPSGSGKTYTALRIARGLVPGGRIAVIDTERGSASLYAGEQTDEGVLDFDVLELDSYEPDRFVKAIKAAGDEGYDVIIVDSLSHAWKGTLEEVDKETAKSRSKNSYMAWRTGTKGHEALIDAMLMSPAHVIGTMRAKTAYETGEKNGRKFVEKIGLAPVQRDGMEYEFTVVADIALDTHTMVVSKTRCAALDGGVFPKAGGDVAKLLREWLETGKSASDEFAEALSDSGIDPLDFDGWASTKGKPSASQMTDGQLWAAARFVRSDAGRSMLTGWVAGQATETVVEEGAA